MHLTTLTAGVLLGAALTWPEASTKPLWYSLVWNVEGTVQQCLASERLDTPEAHIRLVERQHWPYKMVDVAEGGEVVETTLIRFPSTRWGAGSEMTWYRGKDRCEEAKRKEAQRAKDYEQTIQRKYR